MMRRSLVSTLAAAVVLTGLCACGGSDDESPGGDGANGSTVLTEATFLDGLRDGLEATQGAHMDMELKGAGQEMTMSADVDNRSPGQQAIDMTMTSAAGDMHFILVDGIAYLSAPGLGGSKFIKIDPDENNGQLSQMVEEMVTSADLESQFEPWEAGMTGLEYVGQDEVDGVEAQQYRVTVDSAKAFRAQGQPAPAGVPDSLDYDVWLDDDYRMLKVQFEVAGVAADLRVSGHDDEITVEPPSKTEISRQ